MKFLRLLIIFFAAGLVFASCQKELSYESGESSGTLKADGSGDCLPVVVNGTYKKDTLLKTSNTVDVTADIITTGSYFIKTDTINGYSFSASGSAAVTGPTTIHLIGKGKPINTGVDVFTVKYGESTCQINIVVTAGTTPSTAVFTLGGAPATCTGAVLTGTYTQGQAASGTATLNVTVTTPGTYNITTNAANGVTFTGSGTLTTSSTSIVLNASGNAGTGTTGNYVVNTGTSSCSFDVTYAPGAGAATFTMNCGTATPNGTYTAGTAMTTSNTVTVPIQSGNTTGTYSISSNCANGVSFAGTGSFTGTTGQTATITATGTPAAGGTFTYLLTGGTATCSITVTFAASASTDFFNATIDGVPMGFNVTADAQYFSFSGYNVVDLYGISTNCTKDTLEIGIGVLTAGPVNAQTYTVNGTPYIVAGFYTIGGVNTVYSDQSDGTGTPTHATPELTIIVTSSSATRIAGTFSGKIYLNGSQTGTVKTITNGSFSLPVH